MPVRKRGDTWWVFVSVGGRRIRRSAGRGATKRQAEEIERKIQADIHQQRLGREPRRALSEALTRYLKDEVPTMKGATEVFRHAKAVAPYIKERYLDEVVDVNEEMKAAMRAKGLAPATIYQRCAILRRVANLSFDRWSWLEQPLGRAVKMPSVNNERHVYLTPLQVERLASSLDDEEFRKVVLLAAFTGLRRGELLGLMPRHVVGGAIRLESKTKTSRPRTVPVPEHMHWALDGLPLRINANTLSHQFVRARNEVGLPDIRFHDLRHTYASWLVQTGADLLTVQRLMGHSTPSMTARYAHLAESNLNATVVTMAGAVTRKAG